MFRACGVVLLLASGLVYFPAAAEPPAPLQVRLDVDQFVYEAGQPVRGELWVKNPTAAWVKLPQAEELAAGLRLLTPSGEQVQPQNGDLFAAARTNEVGPGGFLGFAFDAARLFPQISAPGKYSLKLRRADLMEASVDFQVIPAFSVDKKYLLRLNTPEGDLLVQLEPKEAPVAVRNIVNLARTGFFDGADIPRIQKGVALSVRGPIQPERHRITPLERSSRELLTGSVVLESSRPNEPPANFPTLIILFSPKPEWQNKATWIGQVVESDPVMLRLAAKPTSGEKGTPPFRPNTPLKIVRATVTEN